jgi:CRP-like cAMP-binding protein
MLGAIGYIPDPASRNVRIVELIARDEAARGSLLRRAVEEAEQIHAAEVIDCDVSAHHPRIQRTLIDLGFLPAGYVPGMVFHHSSRWDVIKMMKLNVAWDLGPMELSEPAQAMFDVVTPPFIQRDEQRRRKQLARSAAVLGGLSPLEVDFVNNVGEEASLAPGSEIPLDCMYIILSGGVEAAGRVYGPGESLGATCLLTRRTAAPACTIQETHVFRLSLECFDDLCSRHPNLGIKLYRNLAEQQDCF